MKWETATGAYALCTDAYNHQERHTLELVSCEWFLLNKPIGWCWVGTLHCCWNKKKEEKYHKLDAFWFAFGRHDLWLKWLHDKYIIQIHKAYYPAVRFISFGIWLRDERIILKMKTRAQDDKDNDKRRASVVLMNREKKNSKEWSISQWIACGWSSCDVRPLPLYELVAHINPIKLSYIFVFRWNFLVFPSILFVCLCVSAASFFGLAHTQFPNRHQDEIRCDDFAVDNAVVFSFIFCFFRSSFVFFLFSSFNSH